MESQNNRMCGTVDYADEVYDDDCFGDILNILDFPVETLEGDGLAEDWASKLGPIPSEVFLPPVSHIGIGVGGASGGGSAELLAECCVPDVESCQPKCQPIFNQETFKSQLKPHQPTYSEAQKLYPIQRSFEAPSPDSVLERRSSSSAGKTIAFGTELAIPVRTRTKRSRPGLTTNPWSRSPLGVPFLKQRKKRRRNLCLQSDNEMKKCSHCEITKTPQWREGPLGPKTLCNACGVRYRSGRLFPEYRPAASPTFIPSVHSNSHRKVIEMRQKGTTGMDDSYVVKKHLSSNPT